jgi:hypothetical protein
VILTQGLANKVNAADQAEQQLAFINCKFKAKASSGSNIDYNTTPKSIEKIEFWSKYRQDLTFI